MAAWLLPTLLSALLLAMVWAGWLLLRDGSLNRVRSSGVLRVGYAVEAPYAWVTADGNVTGESPESARRIAARLGGLRIEWVQVPFAELIPSLRQRRFDMVAAGLFITEARARQVRFSDPTVRVVPALLVLQGNPRRVSPVLDAAAAGPRVAVLDGSVEQTRLQALGLPPARLLVVPDAATGRVALAGGRADALALSLPTLQWMLQQLPGDFALLRDTAVPGAGDRVGFAFHPDDAALQAAWNAAQAGWVGGEEHRRLVHGLGLLTEEMLARTPASLPR